MADLEYFHCAKCAFTRRFIECHYCMRCKEHCVCSPMRGLFEYVTGGVAAVLLIVSMTLFVAVAGILSAAAHYDSKVITVKATALILGA